MATHRVVTKTQRPDGGLWMWGEEIDYTGEPNWKFEPLDPVARAKWERDVIPPAWAERVNVHDSIAGSFREGEDTPVGMWASQGRET